MDHKSDDEKIEQFLRSMPSHDDSRSKESILERLKKDERLLEVPAGPVRKKRKWIPGVVTAAAFMLLAILIPSLLNTLNTSQKSADQSVQESGSQDDHHLATDEREETVLMKDSSSEESVSTQETSQYALYNGDLQEGSILHLGLQDSQAVTLPISLLLTKEQLKEKGLTETATDLELYEAFAGELDEQALGFEPMHPLEASFEEQDNRLDVYLKDTHRYDLSSATQEMFFHSLIQSFPSYREIRILDAAGKPAEFDQVGTVEPVRAQASEAHTPYYLYTQEDGKELLSPNFMQQAGSFEEALHLMQETPNDFFASIFPEQLKFTVELRDEVAEVTFTDRLLLDPMGVDKAEQLIHGLALTAASFGLQLKISNVEPLDWKGMDLGNPLPIALGANLMPFIHQ